MHHVDKLRAQRCKLKIQLPFVKDLAEKERMRDKIATLTKEIIRIEAMDPQFIVGDCPNCGTPALLWHDNCEACGQVLSYEELY